MELGRSQQGPLQRVQEKQEQLGTGPACFRAEGVQGEGMGSQLKLDSPMKLMGGQILP